MSNAIRRDTVVETSDGSCPVSLYAPAGGGRFPGVIVYMDGPGIRPAIHAIAAQLAEAGFAAALPDLFWRAGPYAPVDPKIVFTDPVLKEEHRRSLMSSAGPENAMEDTRAILAAMPGWPEAAAGPVGVVGYCMGGRLALIAAGTFPESIGVAASFHGGGLADDRPSSPHLLAGRMMARVYVGGAADDPSFDAAMAMRLATALSDAEVDHTIETFPARHGWVPNDTPAHDPAEAEHHWRVLIPLLDVALRHR